MQILELSLRNDLTSREAWLEQGVSLLSSAMRNRWEIGDWALQTPTEASRDEVRELLEEAAARTGYEVNSLRDLRTVAERIPPPLRNPNLSWYAHKEISKLIVKEDEEINDEKSLALRSEFIERFAERPNANVLLIRSAVRDRMGRSTSENKEMETVSFKLTTAEHTRLRAIVEADPIHESVPDLVKELVLTFLRNHVEVVE